MNFIFTLPDVEDLLKKISLIYGIDPIRIERNGTGRNNLLFISLILSFIEDRRKAHSIFFRAIGIEEPEAHLHPNLQDHLAANIENLMKVAGTGVTRKDVQLLLTSHSTHVTTKIDFDNTVVLFSEGGIVKPHYILEGFGDAAAEKKNVRYLNKYLDAVNTNLFYSRKIILVEGISEKLLIPTFFRFHKSRTLEQESCGLINVNGLAFRNFLEIIKHGYFIRCVVLTDNDTGTATENRGTALATDYAAHTSIKVAITAHPTFEKDLISSNASGAGRQILINALKSSRPVAGPQHETDLAGADIEVNSFFALIEKHKTDFAYALAIELESNSTGFSIPAYITSAFDFITTR